MKIIKTSILTCLAIGAGFWMALPVQANDFVADIRQKTAELSAAPSRLIGSPGHAEAKNRLVQDIQALPGVTLVRQPFPVRIPETMRAEIHIHEGELQGRHRVYPLWPDGVRLNTTPEEGISGKIIYIEDGAYNKIPAASLRGNIAALEMVHAEKWLRAFEFGAEAVILLGSDEEYEAVAPSLDPIHLPRYYIEDGSLAQTIRATRQTGRTTLYSDAQWKKETGENLLALVPGTDPSARPIVLAGSYDAMSIIPEIAPGADNALDAAFLLRTLTYLAEHPPRRSVIVAFIDGFAINLSGMRELMAMLNVTPEDATRQVYEREINERLSEYEEVAEQVDELGPDPLNALSKIHEGNQYRMLQRYVRDIFSPEIIELQEELFKLRLAEDELEGEERDAVTELRQKTLEQKTDLEYLLNGILASGELPEGSEEKSASIWETIQTRATKQLHETRQSSTIFEDYDALRAEVMEALGIQLDPDTIPVPFVFGIDLSDSGINIGPSFQCGAHYMDYSRFGRQFVRWLRRLIRADDPYAPISEERLVALGLRADGLGELVNQILNVEAIDTPTIEAALRNTIPGISDDVIVRILGAIDRERREDKPRMDEALFRVITRELPEMDGVQAEKLVAEILNLEAIHGGGVAASTAVQELALLTSVAPSFQATGVTWTTLEGFRHRLDTPQDTFEKLNWNRIEPQIRVTALLVEMLLNDQDFEPDDNKASRGAFPRWHLPSGVVVSESLAETIARTPRADMYVTAVNQQLTESVAGFRGLEFIRSGMDGRFRFRPVPANANWQARNRFLRAYTLAEDGSIVRAISMDTSMLGAGEAGRYTMAHRPPLTPARAVTFECVEVNGPIFRDPRYQRQLSGGRILDVNRGGTPRHIFWKNTPGPMFGLLEPGTRYQVILSLGGGRNRMALINVPKDFNETDPDSLREALRIGFQAEEPLPALPELISAQDFFRITEWRLRRLEKAGVVVEAIRDIHENTRYWLDEADKAYEADHGGRHKRAATVALANEVRAYQAVQDVADDVTRGAIFLLLLLVPFSVAMERLLFASPEVGKQISKAIGIFVAMFIILVSFHPGFRITNMPAVIVIAAVILLLSVYVIHIVLSKFRADMEELRRGTLAEASGAQASRGGVMMSAIWLGIANMRKRFVRTMLTGLTIVLVTFALLCFTSSSTYQDKRSARLDGVERMHEGVLLQHPRNMELEGESLDSITNMLGGEHLAVGRYWSANRQEPDWRIHARNAETGQLAALKTGLGLSPDEDRFSKINNVLDDWHRFAEGNGCYISDIVALRLGVEAGDTIVVAGTSLTVIATFDGREFERNVRKLDGQSLLPIDYTVQREEGAMADQEVMERAIAAGEAAMLEPDPQVIHVSADETIILPIPIAKRLNGTLQSIAIEPRADEETLDLADAVVLNIAYPVYYGSADGVVAIVSTPLLPQAPRNLLIPILIASLIIFNTMLNSIAERKREIYIYSSLGLAPRHIGVLFLGEALTYGLMGSIFGYVIGQGLATVLTRLDLMGGITLNYSGSNVIMTMGLVLLIVAISAIIPAIMAIKVASPSGDLDWKVPHPHEGQIKGELPFTVSQQAAPGLAAFLYDYLAAHKDGAIGKFTSDDIRLEKGEDNNLVRLHSTIWPAPYDLGVRQQMTISFEISEGDICELHINLTHGAGQERTWWRLNKVFLSELRAQLLGWRNIAPQRMLKYIRQADVYRLGSQKPEGRPAEA